MKPSALLIAAVVAFGAAPASAQGTANTLQAWGLIGTWAVRCDQPAAEGNSYGRFVAAPDGRAYYERDFGDPSRNDRSEVVSARPQADGTIALQINFTSFGQVRLNVYTKAADGRVRVIYNRGPQGDVTVENGILTHNRRPTPWSTRCS